MTPARWLILGFVFLAALALRVYHLDVTPPGLFFDEAIDGNQALESARTGHFKVFYPENTGREGLFIWLAAIPLRLFGTEPWALRSVSAVAGILTVWGLYSLANLLFGWRIAILASALLATSFVHILLSRVAFRAILAPLCLVWALYFYWRGRQQSSRIHFALSGLFVGLGLYTYTAFRPMLLLFAVLLIWDWRRVERKQLLTFAAVAFIVALPLGLYALQHPDLFWGRVSDVSILATDDPFKYFRWNLWNTARMFHAMGDTNGRHNLYPDPLLPLGVGLFFLIGCALVLSDALRGEKRRAILQLAWFGLALVPQVFAQSSPHFLRSMQIVPLAYLIAAQAMVAMWNLIESKWPARQAYAVIAIAVFLVFNATFEAKKYFVDWGRHPNVPGVFLANHVELGRKLNALPRSQPIYVVVPDQHFLQIDGISMMSQTVMFVTDTYTEEQQKKRNIFYVREVPKHLPPHTLTVTLQ